jgi:hypothetical protein
MPWGLLRFDPELLHNWPPFLGIAFHKRAERLAGAIGIITLKNRTLTPVAQLFIDCAREVAKPMAMPRRRQLQRTRS